MSDTPEIVAVASADDLLLVDHYYPFPWTLVEPADDNGAAYIRDRAGGSVAMMMWPAHGPDDVQRASEATYQAGQMMARIATWKTRPTPPKVAGDAKEIAGRLERVTEELANTSMELSLYAWSEKANALLEAAAYIRANASAAAEIDALREKNAALSELRKVAARNAGAADEARLAAERKLEAAVGVLRKIETNGDGDDLAATFLAAMNTGADDAE